MAFSLVFYCSLFKLYIIAHIIFVSLFNNFHTFIIKFVYYKFFEKWFKEMFLHEVEENKAIVMDNATFHCKSRLYELCKNANKNLKLIFLPPYSPNLNPIEKYWAALKKNLKKITKNNKSLEESIYELF